MNSLLQAALQYGANNWKVLPVHWVLADGGCSCKNALNCHSPGKHPLIKAWEPNASTDPSSLTEWWARYPNANIGIAVGVSGLVAVDVDGPIGLSSLQALEAEYEPLPTTLRHRTGSGGMHLIFHDRGYSTPTRASLRPKLDIRAAGGMIVAPPSLHRSGKRYEVLAGPSVPAPLPYWTYKLIRQTPKPGPRPPEAPPKQKINYIGLGDPSELAAAIYRKLRNK